MAEQTERDYGVSFFCSACLTKRGWKYKGVCPECRQHMDIHATEKVAIVDYHPNANVKKRARFDKVIRDRRKEGFRFLIFIHGYGKTAGQSKTKERLHEYLEQTAWWQNVSWVPGESMKDEKPWNLVGELHERQKANPGVTLLFYKDQKLG